MMTTKVMLSTLLTAAFVCMASFAPQTEALTTFERMQGLEENLQALKTRLENKMALHNKLRTAVTELMTLLGVEGSHYTIGSLPFNTTIEVVTLGPIIRTLPPPAANTQPEINYNVHINMEGGQPEVPAVVETEPPQVENSGSGSGMITDDEDFYDEDYYDEDYYGQESSGVYPEGSGFSVDAVFPVHVLTTTPDPIFFTTTGYRYTTTEASKITTERATSTWPIFGLRTPDNSEIETVFEEATTAGTIIEEPISAFDFIDGLRTTESVANVPVNTTVAAPAPLKGTTIAPMTGIEEPEETIIVDEDYTIMEPVVPEKPYDGSGSISDYSESGSGIPITDDEDFDLGSGSSISKD